MSIVSIIIAILVFSFLIIGHEFGHFIMAKINGVQVEEFAIGMGPKLYSFKGKETAYSIRIFPIGGFVKMLGEDDEVEKNEKSFSVKSPGRKLSIIAAGPIMNLIIAIMLFTLSYGISGYRIPVVSKVITGSTAEKINLKQGDIITKINDVEIKNWDDLSVALSPNSGEEISLSYIRNNENYTVLCKPEKTPTGRYIIGFEGQVKKYTLFESLSKGITDTKTTIGQTLGFFGTLFQGKAKASDIGGPITIIRVTGEVAKLGIATLLAFNAYISIQLAIFNFIPFPALDGGSIVIYTYELITRKHLDAKKIGLINYVGFAILMALTAVVFIKDILFPVALPF